MNVPTPELRKAVHVCGSKSRRDCDKLAECGLTAAPSRSPEVASPTIAECGLAYECRIVHRSDIVPEALAAAIASSAYPGGDYHRLYFGQILAVHADPDFEQRFGSA